MHNSESVLENETHNIWGDFEIQTDHLISARWPVNKKKREREKTCRIVNFAFPADHRVKLKESGKRDKYQDLVRDLKKAMELESDGDTDCNWGTRNSHQRIDTETGGPGDKRMSRDHSNYSIIEIGQNIKKSPGDLRRLNVTQIPVENHQLTLV